MFKGVKSKDQKTGPYLGRPDSVPHPESERRSKKTAGMLEIQIEPLSNRILEQKICMDAEKD